MSHLVTITTQVREPQAIAAACQRLQLPGPRHGQFEIYRQTVTGHAVQLRAWRYPLVCDVTSGQLHYDNFSGCWGEPARLDEFLQAYAVEYATTLARRQGFSVVEQPLPSGAIQLTVQQGGVA
jgi:hypothetical protein